MVRVACSAALSLDELVTIAVAQAKAATRAAAGILFLLDGDELVVAAGDGYPAELMNTWSRFALSADTPASSVVRNRRAEWFSDPAEKARRYPDQAPKRTGFNALAALPINSRRSTLGVLGISFRHPREFAPVERLFLLMLADQVGIALARILDAGHGDGVLHRTRLADPVRRRAVTDAMSAVDAARATIDGATALARTICDADRVHLSLIGDEWTPAAGSGAAPGSGPASPVAVPLCAVTNSPHAPLTIAASSAAGRLPAPCGGTETYLGAPVSVRGVVVGALCVCGGHPRAWSDRQRELMDVLAAGIGTELTLRSRAAREGRLLRSVETRTRLRDRLAAAGSVSQVAGALLEAVADVDGVVGAAVTVCDEQAGMRHHQARCSDSAVAAALGVLAAQPPGPDGVLNRSLSLSDLIDELLGDASPLVEIGARRAELVRMPGRLTTGWLAVALEDRADTEPARRDLIDLAHLGGVAFDQTAMQERHQLATGRAAFLAAASAHLEASLDIDETLQRMTRIAVPALAEGCLVFLADPGGLRLAAASHLDIRVEKRIKAELGADPAFLRIAESALAEPVATGDDLPGWLRAERVRSTPLRGRGRLVGLITLLDAPSDGLPHLADDTLMADLAIHAAITIDNALLYAKRSADLAALQYRLLPPRLPLLPEFDVAAHYQAGDRSLDVGGDFYDVITLAEDRRVFMIGDVCGRGAAAASITGLARAVLRTVIQEGASPAQALQRLNEAMRTAGDRGELCTAVVVRIDGRGDECHLTAAVGGHPLPLLRRAGDTTEIGRHGPMLGLLASPVFHEVSLPLAGDDVVLLYTDGITESRRGDEFFGSRLVTAVTEAGQSAEQVITVAMDRVELFRDESNDDIAMLAVRPRGRSLAGIELPDLTGPSAQPAVRALISRVLADHEAARRNLCRRLAVLMTLVPPSVTGPVHVGVLKLPGRWRVEITRVIPPDGPVAGARGPSRTVPGALDQVRHGMQVMASIEVVSAS
ncbi:SpoIIE family protein phosphatase [Actinoplanes palleronii]|uniref:GAF domain-containing protein n=1 Tax=Actinoplanes palleronii TaxID=113570 RepID=A0ABQ4BME2_9ACTN|nr:SpoIIE family protein phosphatase [Actinoplanes palleronii]GIE71849.1 hypothetical protein Apa02nite_079570 [Actinoplanes palleronii]